MQEFVAFDLASSALLNGKGVFTTVAICNGLPFLWEKHWRRLTADAQKLQIEISAHTEASVADQLVESISRSDTVSGRARVSFFDQSPSALWSSEDRQKGRLFILVAERREIAENFKLTISPHRINTTSPLVGVKSCNYLDHLMAIDEARSRGFAEAIRLNERGEIASACMSNVFWSKGDRLFTPSLKTGCLAGTTREFVLENLECEEVEAGKRELETADALFLTSAGIGVMQVSVFEKRILQRVRHRIEDLLREVTMN